VAGDDQAALAAAAFVYGFPLVFDPQEVDRFTRHGIGGVPATPFNRFGHASTLAGPEARFVSINNDTVYSIAQLDLSAGPVRLEVPDTGVRYYVLQFVDAWTNNFAYVGHRATGTQAGSFLLLPPGDEAGSGRPGTGHPLPTAAYHIFDYNLDFFEIGALDDPAWKLKAEPQDRYLLRAGAARSGLWGNHGYEAAYAMVYEDADGEQLTGRHRYILRFDRTPPVGAFWSVTMYDTPDFYLVANPIGRYSIGDRTPGLHTAEDGSLTINMQRDEPSSPADRANWLPTPPGDFRPILRMYEPDPAVFDGSYQLPPITKRP
jgi:hypothetical protein